MGRADLQGTIVGVWVRGYHADMTREKQRWMNLKCGNNISLF